MVHIPISITSDTVCPWCYVGYSRLNSALSQHASKYPSDTFSITWLPFYLNPNAPKHSIDKRDYYASKFGANQASAIFQRLGAVGKDAGIDFSFGGKTGSTRDSHRLIAYAGTKGEEMQTKVVKGLFARYFEREGDITSHSVLQDAGIEAGLDKAEVERVLGSDEMGSTVDKEVNEAKEKMVSGVPFFEVAERFAVEGAQEPQAFVQLFEKVRKLEEDDHKYRDSKA